MVVEKDPVEAYFEEFPLPTWILNEARTIVFMNREMKELFGDLVGENAECVYGNSKESDVPNSDDIKTRIDEVRIADVPFRRLIGYCNDRQGIERRVEILEDISDTRNVQRRLAKELSHVRKETQLAKRVQKSILPINDTYWNTIALNTIFLPAEDLSGDFFDLLRLSEDEFLLYIADVSGHGIQASLLTVYMQERVRANSMFATEGLDILLARLVTDFCALELSGSIYLTIVFCKYNRKKRELSIANAGHNCAPLILRDNGRSETVPIKGMPISVIAGKEVYAEEIVSLHPGDRILLFTDGVVEEIDSTKKKAYGQEGVRETAERNRNFDGNFLAHAIIEESARFSPLKAKDDRTILVADILA